MALADEAKADGVPEEVVAEIEGAQEGGEGGEQAEAPVTIRLSRRKKEQEARSEELRAANERAANAERIANELRQQHAQQAGETAHLRGTVEQMQRQWQSQQQQAPRAAEEPVERRIAAEQRAAEEALSKSDLREYHERMGRVMDMKAEAQARAIIAAQPKAAAAAPAPEQRAPWVMAIEMQYPDVLSHPRGQYTVGVVDHLLNAEAWGPARLHKAFERARQELGLKPAPAPASNGQRALYGSVQSTATGGGRAAGGEDRVTVPKDYLAMAMRSGMTKAQAAKAWKESYPDET